MNAQQRVTRVSWPVKGADGKRHRRHQRLDPCWSPPPEDPLVDPETGEPRFWHVEHVRGFLVNAMDALDRLAMNAGGRPRGKRSGMPEYVREFWDSFNSMAVRSRLEKARALPTPSEIATMDRVLDWLLWLPEKADRIIVTGVAMGMNLRAIGRVAGFSHTHVRRRETVALQVIADALNAGREKSG